MVVRRQLTRKWTSGWSTGSVALFICSMSWKEAISFLSSPLASGECSECTTVLSTMKATLNLTCQSKGRECDCSLRPCLVHLLLLLLLLLDIFRSSLQVSPWKLLKYAHISSDAVVTGTSPTGKTRDEWHEANVSVRCFQCKRRRERVLYLPFISSLNL